MHSDVYEPILFKLGVMIGTTKLLYFSASLNCFDFYSRSQGCEKETVSLPLISQSINEFGWYLKSCWELSCMINIVLIFKKEGLLS